MSTSVSDRDCFSRSGMWGSLILMTLHYGIDSTLKWDRFHMGLKYTCPEMPLSRVGPASRRDRRFANSSGIAIQRVAGSADGCCQGWFTGVFGTAGHTPSRQNTAV